MSEALGVVWTVFWGVLVLSFLVFIHEAGHYLVSRLLNVRATELFLGFPCRFKLSFKSRKVGTEFGVTPVLLGGYTRICGMEGMRDELLAPALDLVTKRGRITAQELADELGIDLDRAYGLLEGLCEWASVQPGDHDDKASYPDVYLSVARDANLLTEYDRGHDFTQAGSTAAGEPRETGLPPEEFLAMERGRTYEGASFPKRLAMLAAGPVVNVVFAFLVVTAALMIRGVDYVSNVNVLGTVEAGSPAAIAGLEAGDELTVVDGTDVDSWEGIVEALAAPLAEGRDFDVTFVRDGSERTVTVDLPDGEPTDLVGVTATVETYHPDLVEASSFTLDYVRQVAVAISRLLQPQHTMEVLDQSSSVVGIAVMASSAASAGVYDLAVVVAAISLSLGLMNLLPIPPFDGGKILIEVVQAVIRRPLPPRAVAALSYVGLAFVLFVFVVVLKNDVVRIFLG